MLAIFLRFFFTFSTKAYR
ncbi:hypothetical protein [Leptotrichia buccalis]